jgi:hypothetical protein
MEKVSSGYPPNITRFFFLIINCPAVFMPCKALRGGLYQIRTYAWLHLTGPLFQQNQPSWALPYIKSKTIYMHMLQNNTIYNI